MGLISRHSGAPFANGEALEGPDLEQDFATIYAEFNGSIDNENVAADADISGTKLADNTIPNAKLGDDTLTLGKVAATAVSQAGFSRATGTGTLTSSTVFVDVDGLSAVDILVGSTADIILADFRMDQAYSGSGTPQFYGYGFSVNGTDTDVLSVVEASFSSQVGHVVVNHATTAPATGTISIKARYKKTGGANPSVLSSPGLRVLRVQLIPVKG